MARNFMQLVLTPAVQEAQERHFGKRQGRPASGAPDSLTEDEARFIAARDSFYLATTNSDGWPYIQHRGGPAGFLRVLGPNLLGFADYRGNQQMLTTGNVASNDRVALFLMDYPNRERLKILGHARVVAAKDDPALAAQLADPAAARIVERLMLIDVVGFDWNCPQYITPRHTDAAVRAVIEPLRQRIAELEAELAEARG